jgi:hypothetical protein
MRTTTITTILAAGALAGSAQAQYTISKWTVDGGAVMNAAAGPFTLSASAGQPDAGTLGNPAGFQVFGGFWSPIPPPDCPADFNDDGFLDFFDYDDYVNCFETGVCPPGKTADINGDGFADFFDYDDFVSAFEAGC